MLYTFSRNMTNKKKKGKKKIKCLPPVRFELTTPGLQDQCSATEL